MKLEFSAEDHWLKQIWRQDDVAVYERSLSKDKPPHELELVVIKMVKEKVMPDGTTIPTHEAYPCNSDWGHLGWSFPASMQSFVMDLAVDVLRIKKNRPTFIRARTHEMWLKSFQKDAA